MAVDIERGHEPKPTPETEFSSFEIERTAEAEETPDVSP